MKKRLLFFIVFFLPVRVVAQEMWGISNSNFAGMMGMSLNPATMVAAPYSTEINLLSGDLFIQNNYIYIRKKSLQTADFYTKTDKRGYLAANIKGPSFIINRGNTAFAFHSAIRAGLSAKNVPFHFAKFAYDGFDFVPQHGINFKSGPFQVAGLTWIETGLSFGMVLKETKSNLFSGAITLNYQQGLSATFIEINHLDYIVPTSQLLIVKNINGRYGHTGFDNTANIPGQIFAIHGQGFSCDLGFNFFHNRMERAYSCGKRSNSFKKYNYKIGFSLIDLGYIQMNKSVSMFSFKNAAMQWPGIDTIKFENLADFDTSLSNRFFNNPKASLKGRAFTVYLPGALSFQVDYCLKPRWYINATWIQRIPFGKTKISRPNQVSLTPRYETRGFEIALPVSLYDYGLPRFGLALRYQFIILGTDKAGAFTRLWDVTGVDFYFGIKFALCNNKKKRKRGGDCFTF